MNSCHAGLSVNSAGRRSGISHAAAASRFGAGAARAIA